MNESDQFDPEVVAALEAIDATLAGQAVDPRHAELAELALLLADERPAIDPAFATVLDEGVQRRFEAAPKGRRQRVSWFVWAPASAVAVSLVVAVVIVVGQSGGGGGGVRNGPETLEQKAASGGAASKAAVHFSPAPKEKRPADGHLLRARALSPQSVTATTTSTTAPAPGGSAASAGSASGSADQPSSANNRAFAPAVQSYTLSVPGTTSRKVVQGARLSLSTTSKRVGQVAQEVFNVIGQQKGVVKSSQVTANGGHGGYAQFQLSVPEGNLAATMTALSNLQYAQVASRTDTSQDVTNQFRVDQRRLADDRALRTALLKQLASAVTQTEIDSLNARIHDAAAAISRDENALHAINRSVGYSQIYVTINAGAAPPVPVHKGGGGFTVGQAAHDAGHVLTVAAGVALIGLAALLPVSLVLALAWWIYATLRRRWRQQALDQI
jgi:hypothetical protein